MQGKARQSLRMQLKYNMIIQFKFQAFSIPGIVTVSKSAAKKSCRLLHIF